MSKEGYRDGQLVEAADVKNIVCPECGEKVGLNADKAHEGIDHPDCKFRFGLSAPVPQTQYRLTISRLETPLRTFAEDKKAKKEEAQEAKKEAKAVEKEEAQQKSKAGSKRK